MEETLQPTSHPLPDQGASTSNEQSEEARTGQVSSQVGSTLGGGEALHVHEVEQMAQHENNIPLSDMSSAGASSGAANFESTVAAGSGTDGVAPATVTGQSSETPSDIGPAKSGLNDDGPTDASSEPAVYTTLCVANTENRHRWKITTEYLRRRGEPVPTATASSLPGDELLDVSIASIKRLLIADWRHDWEARPTDTAQIRLISMGEALMDEKTLRDHRFKVNGPPRPVLLSVRRPIEDEHDHDTEVPGKNPPSRGVDGQPRSRMCGCCTVM